MYGVKNYLLHTGLVSSQPEPSVWQCLVCIPSSEYPVLHEYVIVMPSSDELMSPLVGVFGVMQTEIQLTFIHLNMVWPMTSLIYVTIEL